MSEHNFFTAAEKSQFFNIYAKLKPSLGDNLEAKDYLNLKKHLTQAAQAGVLKRNMFNMNSLLVNLQTALLISEEISLKRTSILGLLLSDSVKNGYFTLDFINKNYGEDVGVIVKGLIKTSELYNKTPDSQVENFRNLLISLAEDMRVILIIIAARVNIMRHLKECPNIELRNQVSHEAIYLYAPLAHKLGLYALKSELEDLSLKYTNPIMYQQIKEKLNETKTSRDNYIKAFLAPIYPKLDALPLVYDLKGRTKSIHSIWNKMVKQKTPFEGIYDLFAIRIIIDTELEKEKQACWQAYSVITDMYPSNPNRMRDWLSMPKSNGYESLHATVMGMDGKWVEVQIRTKRMDEIAERGLAAHWKYKGIKGENGLDDWLTSVREALENSDGDSLSAMDEFKMSLYSDEIFVFTPKGDLHKLAKGATVLDFAFSIHSKLGSKCIGAKINHKNVPIKQVLKTGDQVEIITSSTQSPKQDWLKIVVTSKARTKIRQAIKELNDTQTEFAKEALLRRFKNKKVIYDDGIMMRLIKKMGFKTVSDFYVKIAENSLDTGTVLENYVEQQKRETENIEDVSYRSAEGFNMQTVIQEHATGQEDVLVIDQNLKGIDFKLAKCCSPIYGDDVFGFVSINNGIKVHRDSCPNAAQLHERFGYRIVKARWAGKSEGATYPISLKVIGHDDIGIVTNISSVIAKEGHAALRSITIESNDGLFSGTLVIMISDTSMLNLLIKKIRAVKGVKQVERN